MKRQTVLGISVVLVAIFLFSLCLFATANSAHAQANLPPVSDFTFSPAIPAPGETITFNASTSYSPNGWIAQYAWDFGDGVVTSVSNSIITHSYPVDGNYTVALTVTDNTGSIATSVAVVQVETVVFFRVGFYGTLIPISNVKVTVFYNNGTAWVAAPAGSGTLEIKYDNMTQPNLANTAAEKYRNPGYTASILRANASNIGFDIQNIGQVFFKFEWGPYVAYWPNATTRVYTYDNGAVDTYDYNPAHGAQWNSAASAYVIDRNHIPDNGVAPTESHPIIVGILAPPPPSTFYLTVATSPLGITTIPGQGSYATNTNVTLTAPTYVNVSSSTRYRFNYWDVDGASQGTGVNPITVFMNANHTATAHYVTQYSLTFSQTGLLSDATGTIVTVNGTAETLTQLPYTLWADSGSSVTYSYTSIVTSSVSGKQYRLNTVSGPTSPITVSSATTVTGNYVTQFLVTFAQTGLDSTANGTVVVVNGTSKTYLQLPYSFWADSGSSITYSYSSPASSSTAGKQFRLSSVNGPSSPITLTGPVTVTGNYVWQYLVTFAQSGLDSTASGTIVTVNGGPKIFSALPYTSWFDASSSITYSYTSIVPSSVSGKQFRLNSVTGAPSPVTVTGPTIVTGNYVAQYQVTFAQTGLDSTATGTVVTVNSNAKAYGDLTYTLWVDSGGSVTYSYNSIVTSSVSGKQFTLLSVTGSSSPITITGPTNIIGNYKTQYFLTVTSPYDSPSPSSGWFDSGSGVTDSVTSPVSGGSGIQYVCTGWTGTGSVPASGSASSTTFTMTQASSITWNWKTQYYLTVTSAYDSPTPVSGWFDSGSGVTDSVTSPVSGGSGIQYVCTGWTGSGSVPGSGSASSVTFTINSPSSIAWNWKTQYQVTFDQSGVGTDFAGTVVTVDSVNYGVSGLPVSFWWDSSSGHSFSFASPLTVGSKQYVWSSTSGLSTFQSGTLTATASGSVVGNYIVQNEVTFDQVGVGSDFSGTVVIIDSISYSKTQLPISFSWSINSTHNFAFQSPLIVGANAKQYIWTNTTGLSTLQNDPITVTTYGSIIGNYKTQYYLTVSSPYDSPSPLSGWFDSGSGVTDSVTSPVSGGSGIQYVCTGWTGTGSVPASGVVASVTFTINAPSTVTWNWKTQYYLTVTSPYDSPTPLSGWFDSGTGITDSVTSPTPGSTGTQYVCTGWAGTGSVPGSGSASSVTFTINSPSSITWNWKTQYYLTVTSPYDSPSPASGWFDSGSGVTDSVTSPVSGGSGIQYVCTGWSGTGSVPSSGSTSSVTFTVTQASNITWNWTTQYQVTFDHSGLGSSASSTVATVNGTPITFLQLPYAIWVDSGNSITYSYNNVSSSTLGKQFILIGVTGLPSPITVTSPMTVVGNYKIQYQVTFSQAGVGSDFTGTVLTVDSSAYTISSLPVSFWWDASSLHTFSFSSPLIVNASEQYNWVSTSGLTGLQSGSLTVSGAGSVTGNYSTGIKYQITFSQNGVSPDYAGAVVTIDGTNYTVTSLPASFWWDSGSVHTFAYQSPLVVTPNSKQYVWTSTSGLSSLQSDSITVTTAGTVTGNYKTQYYLTLTTNPIGVTSPSGSGWYDNGTQANISTVAFMDIVPGSSRYRFNGWTTQFMLEITNPLASPTSVEIDQAKTVTANYVVQYNVTFAQTGVGLDFIGTVVVVDGVNFTVTGLPVSFWWDNNTAHAFAFQSPLVTVPNAKAYGWTSTAGLSTLQAGTLTILAPGSVTGNYRTQYYLTVTSPYDSPTPTSGWFNSGAIITASVTSPAAGPAGTQYVCTGWSGTGNVPSSGSGATTTFSITQASTITWNWKTQYYLTVQTNPLALAAIPGQGWYDAGSSSASLNAPPVTGWNFSFWDVDGASQGGANPITVNMSAAHTATAHYTSGHALAVSISPMTITISIGNGVPFASIVSGGTGPYTYRWYLDGIPGATTSGWTFMPGTSGIYYVYVVVTDATNTMAQSGTARVEVISSAPVGGFSISMEKPTPLSFFGAYMGLVALFGAVFCIKRRKRK